MASGELGTVARSRLTVVADLLLAGGGLAWLIALVYLLHRADWLAEQQHTITIGSVIRYGGPALMSALLFGCLLLRPRLRENLALLLFSTGVALYGSEIVLQNLRPGNSTLWTPNSRAHLNELVKLAREFGVEYDTRTQLQVVKDLREQRIDAVPSVYPFGLLERQPDGSLQSRIQVDGKELLALSGVSDRPTVFCNEAGQWITYQSDRHGFNNPADVWDLEALDVAVLGDSFAHGACVPVNRNFTAVIRKHYPATLNLGNSNKGPLMSLADLKEYAAAFRPTIVLWFLYEGNDFADLIHEAESPLLMRYLERDFTQNLAFHQSAIDEAFEQHWGDALKEARIRWPEETAPGILGVIRFSGLRRILRQARLPDDRAQELVRSIDLFADVIAEAKLAVDSWGGQLYLVYLPERDRFADSSAAVRDEKKRRAVMDVAGSLGVEFIDIPAAFQSDVDPLELFPFRRRGHYNEDGHRLVGETVLQSISPALADG
jgi:hypothetical protein